MNRYNAYQDHAAQRAARGEVQTLAGLGADASPLKIDIWTDFLCPFCYLTTLRVDRLTQTMPVEVEWHAFMLRPPAAPPMPEHFHGIVAAEYQRVGYDIATEFGLRINPGPIGLRTHLAHLATKRAQEEGLGGAFHRAVMRAYWLEGQAIDDPEVLTRIGHSVGIDGNVVDRDHGAVEGEAALRADQEGALAYGARAVPLLVFDGRIILRGAQTFNTLADVAGDAMHSRPAPRDA